MTSLSPFTATAESCSLISSAPRRIRLHWGEIVSPPPPPPAHPTLLLLSPLLASSSLTKPSVQPGVLSVPDSYRLTLKHKRGERRNRQIDRQKEDGNTNRVGGDGYRLSSSVIMLSISIFKSLLLLLSPFKIHQRKRNKRDGGIYWDFKKKRRRRKKLGCGAHAIKSLGYTSSVSDKGNKFGKSLCGKDWKALNVKLSESGASGYWVCRVYKIRIMIVTLDLWKRKY